MHSYVHVVAGMGGDLGGLGKHFPQKIWGGGRPMHPSPNIWRNNVTGCV